LPESSADVLASYLAEQFQVREAEVAALDLS
jgi:hypothetical protein